MWTASAETIPACWHWHDSREDPAEDVLAPTLTDARQRGVIRQRLVQGVTDEPADREIDLRFPHQAPVMDDPEKKAGQHQAHSDLGVDAGAAVVGARESTHFSTQPLEIENLINPHQHMVVRDQAPE